MSFYTTLQNSECGYSRSTVSIWSTDVRSAHFERQITELVTLSASAMAFRLETLAGNHISHVALLTEFIQKRLQVM